MTFIRLPDLQGKRQEEGLLISKNRNLMVLAVFSSLFAIGLTLSWLFSAAADADLEACERSCSAKSRVVRIGAVEIRSLPQPDAQATERQCICE